VAATKTRVAIVGASGPTGFHLAHELVEGGNPVRAISRSIANLERSFSGVDVELAAADALDEVATRKAIEGCGVVVDCVGLPADRMSDHPSTARTLATAARDAGARCVHVSSTWSFLPVGSLPLDETHPRQGGNRYIELRREAEDILRGAGAAIVHLPDFFGPRVHMSTLQNPLAEAVAGKATNWIGRADTERDYVFVPDAMRVVTRLIDRDEAYGQSWIIPGSGPISPTRVAKIAGEHLHSTVKVRAAAPWLLKLLGLFSADLRAFLPMVPHYARPIRYDASKLEGLLGRPAITPYESAIPATLDWIAGRS
jgi:nucleoside-diphosphate-sugar epimerase